ncbi:hypothetical protein ECANGB1_396 [Enterospora canceri]|uniref:Uncharacterized protein n=1 Tax=Enterospora canceri TaxID=1081671 RepID=A0A1Y1S847_9MICR|nr:hypothetical protein ECANGB1_396 [Enterospora canceri]
MLVIWSWMIHLLGVKCDEDANYQKLKTEYDKLKTATTMSPSKKYYDKLVIFPDVKRNANIDKVELTEINSTSNTINTINVLGRDTTAIDLIKNMAIGFLTTSMYQNQSDNDDIMNFFTADSCTVEKVEAAITQLNARIKEIEEKDIITRFMHEAAAKIIIKLGKDYKLTANEKKKELENHFRQLPYLKRFHDGIGNGDATTYMYMTFTIGSKTMKSEIIRITKKERKIQTIHDLEEYEIKITPKKETPKKVATRVETPKKVATTVKPPKKKETIVEPPKKKKKSKKKETPKKKKTPKKKTSKKKETPRKEVSKKKETSKKSKILVAIILVVVGIVILSIGTLILIKKRKTTEVRMVP